MDDNVASNHLPVHDSRYSNFNLKISHSQHIYDKIFRILVDNEESD